MKSRKSLLILLPVFVFVATFMIVKTFNSASYAINSDTAEVVENIKDGTEYKMVRKNTYSYHLVSHHFNTFGATNAPGTKLIQSKSGNNKAVVYCAQEGKTLSQSSTRKRYSLNSSKVNLYATRKNRLSVTMPFMYPYKILGETSETPNSIKEALKNPDYGIDKILEGDYYSKYHYDDLNVNEAITAVQAALWNMINLGKSWWMYYDYRGTISYFGAFNSCSDYYNNKVITSEEEAWYRESGCSSSGKFYKYVYNHKKDGNTENRINNLILWYIRLHSKAEYFDTSADDYFEYDDQNSSFTSNGTTATLVAKFKTNLTDYKLVFKDEAGNTLLETNNVAGHTYTINNIALTVRQINVEVVSRTAKNNVYYYVASSGQDFIGLEKSYYTSTENLSITREGTGRIIIYKVGNRDMNVEVSSRTGATADFDPSRCGGNANQCLSNAKFGLYIDDPNHPNDPTKRILIREIETNYSDHGDYDEDSGQTAGELDLSSVIIDNLPLGTYYLKETQPAYGYDLYTSGIGVVDQYGFIKIEVTGENTYDVVVNNTQTKICITKVDGQSSSTILDNAIYEIRDIDDNVIEEFRTSSQQGSYCLTGQLQAGSYFLQEVEAPFGYILDSKKYHFVVGRGESDISSLEDVGEYTTITPVNNVITLKNRKGVTISKSDVTTGACVSGAELTVRDSNGEIVTDSNGNQIGRWISTCGTGDEMELQYSCVTGTETGGENDYICTERRLTGENTYSLSLPAGTYTLTETMTPELQRQGYSSESETVTFTVDADGNVSSDLDMKDAPIKACIYKVSKDSKDPIAGAVFEIYEKGSDTPYTTLTSSEMKDNNCIDRLPFGTYIVKEIKAPDGYEISNEEIEIEVKNTKERQEFYIEDEVIAPRTALDNTQLLIIIASIFMMFGIGLVGYYGFKKQN